MRRSLYISFFKKVFYKAFVISYLLVSAGMPVFSQGAGNKQMTVVIDAGHGGKDPGAHGKKSCEKDVVLAIALKLGDYIQKYLPDVRVIYTRNADVFIPLHERADIANKNQADLFISIHANANPNPVASGTETYTMGITKNQDNLEVAKTENAVILKEDDYTNKYGGYDPNSPESFIIFSLLQNTYAEQSINFASDVQTQFQDKARRYNRGIKQAGFLVLWRTTMPSVLIETGFISNPEEERYLTSDHGQDYLASAIFRAFRNYKHAIENRSIYAIAENNGPAMDSSASQPLGSQNDTVVTDQTDKQPATPVKDQTAAPDIEFLVQISASKKSIPLQSSNFKGLENVEEFHTDNIYKYAVGRKASYTEIVAYSKIVKNYFPDAFIIALRKGKIIPLKEALKEINN